MIGSTKMKIHSTNSKNKGIKIFLLLMILSSCFHCISAQDKDDTNVTAATDDDGTSKTNTTTRQVAACNLNVDLGYTCSSPGWDLWYYDRFTATCKPFSFRGCGGNSNQFSSQSDCLSKCRSLVPVLDSDLDGVPDSVDQCPNTPPSLRSQVDSTGCVPQIGPAACRLGADPGQSCTSSQRGTRWYFDVHTRACQTFFFQGCGGNSNNFPSQAICNQACISWDDDQDGICNIGVLDPRCTGSDQCPGTPATERPVDSNGCSQRQVDEDLDGVCDAGKTSTIHCSGSDLCPGTPPSLRSQVDATGCVPQTGQECSLTVNQGRTCAGIQPSMRWYYSSISNSCQQFWFLGCGGNGNNFLSQSSCLQACRGSSICLLPPSRGSCNQNIRRWYHDVNLGCREFFWSGCGGNQNNFLTFDSCVKNCDQAIEPAGRDDDRDGICNIGHPGSGCVGQDRCPNTPSHERPVDSNGCSQRQVDGDLDGVCNRGTTSTLCFGSDLCPNTLPSQRNQVDATGCVAIQPAGRDDDRDGICNIGHSGSGCVGQDRCPNTPLHERPVDRNGCSQRQVDGDLDGVCNIGSTSTLCFGSDLCPNTPPSQRNQVDVTGCVAIQPVGIDDDRDGICDVGGTGGGCVGRDACLNTPLNERPVDSNGCSRSQVDSDLDGICDRGRVSSLCRGRDLCPNTPPGTRVDSNGCPIAGSGCPRCPLSVFDTLPAGCTACVP